MLTFQEPKKWKARQNSICNGLDRDRDKDRTAEIHKIHSKYSARHNISPPPLQQNTNQPLNQGLLSQSWPILENPIRPETQNSTSGTDYQMTVLVSLCWAASDLEADLCFAAKGVVKHCAGHCIWTKDQNSPTMQLMQDKQDGKSHE